MPARDAIFTVDFGKSLHIAPLCFYARKSNED